MNQEIAGKLLALRKQNGYSQEELAEKLGISRQAISKWERGDASPDTGNLIALARIYNISLDRLFDLNPDETCQRSSISLKKNFDEGQRCMYPQGSSGSEKYLSGNDKSSVATDEKKDNNAHINYEAYDKAQPIQVQQVNQNSYSNPFSGAADKRMKKKIGLPYAIIVTILFFLMGSINLWHPAWMLFLTIPLYYTGILAAKKKNLNIFCYPVLVTLMYLISGFNMNLWHPGWMLFLTIPLYYWFVNTFLHNNDDDKNINF